MSGQSMRKLIEDPRKSGGAGFCIFTTYWAKIGIRNESLKHYCYRDATFVSCLNVIVPTFFLDSPE